MYLHCQENIITYALYFFTFSQTWHKYKEYTFSLNLLFEDPGEQWLLCQGSTPCRCSLPCAVLRSPRSLSRALPGGGTPHPPWNHRVCSCFTIFQYSCFIPILIDFSMSYNLNSPSGTSFYPQILTAFASLKWHKHISSRVTK